MNISETQNRSAAPDLFGVTEGIFCQQCNCRGAYGAGISGAIAKRFPVVEQTFRDKYMTHKGFQFGTYNIVKCTERLSVANIYSQDFYGGYGAHTDIDALTDAVTAISTNNPDKMVYLPHHFDPIKKVHGGIGAGLGGGKWEDIENAIQKVVNNEGLKNVALWDSIEQKLDKVFVPQKEKTKFIPSVER